MTQIIGIDLGTTNSLVAYMKDGNPKVIPDSAGHKIIPSVIAFGEKGLIVGESAKHQLITDAEWTVYSIKRLMGKSLADVQNELKYFPLNLGERSTSGEGIITIRIGERLYTPPELSALILLELKGMAEDYFKKEIRQAVITVPAYFNDSQRQATKDAGRIAGLEVLRIINEPTAACLAYGLQKKKQGIIAVYDLGGGTFDISILKVKEGIFEVLATNGITHLGGDDLDRRLMGLILKEILEKHGRDLKNNQEALGEVRLVAEEAKRTLSSKETAEIVVPFPNENKEYRRILKRSELENLVEDLAELTVGPCQQALKDAGLTPGDVDEVVLVGGSTRMPLIQRTVEKVFKKQPHCELDPDEVVALGAAVQADILAGGILNMLLLDVTPLSLGIEMMGGVVNILIPRNTTIPTMAKELFTTFVDGQSSVDIHVLQGERELVKDNRSLARFQLKNIEPLPAGMPRIEVTFMIDANGILSVTAKDQRSGKEQSIDVKPSYGLTDSEVEHMIEESVQYARKDVETRMLIEARMEATTLMRHVERALNQGRHIIDEIEKTRIQNAVTVLKKAMDGEDHRLIRQKMEALDQVTRHLAETLMNSTLQETLEGKSLPELPK
jgi:molecular chaperone DnaK